MRKIIIGLMSIILTIGAAAGTAYAAYTSSVQLKNVSFGLDTAPNLEVAIPGVNGDNFTQGPVDLSNNILSGLQPGESKTITIQIKNNGTTGQVTYALSAQLVPGATGDWTNLSKLITVQFGSGPSGTLAQWNNSSIGLGVTVDPQQVITEPIKVTLSPDATNTVAGETLTTNWVLTGTSK